MHTVHEVDAITGVTVERDATPLEVEERAQQALLMEEEAAAAAAQKEKDDITRAAAVAHAKSLGFTDAMIAVMYPNLGNP